MTSRASFMTEDEFWELIDASKGEDPQDQLDNLVSTLASTTPEKIAGFDYVLCRLLERSYDADLWAAAHIVLGGCSDDEFDSFRAWLIACGRDVFKNALEDPDTLADVFDKFGEDDYPENDELWYVAGDAYEEMTGKGGDAFDRYLDGFDDDFDMIEINLEWSDDDPETLRKICPVLFETYYEDPLGCDFFQEA